LLEVKVLATMGGVTDELTIGEVATRTGVSVSALRFYEQRGLVRADRTAGGQRRYRREVLRRVAFIVAAQRVGVTLDEIGAALASLPRRRTPTASDWAALSQRWRRDLDQRIRLLEGLRDRLDECIGCGCLSLDRCAIYNADDAAQHFGPGPRFLYGDRLGSRPRKR
jgi:MerR family transcriptional regulator, redox-sensitive transcriptional activator SoxR